ncbi:MAG: hypothetical protein ABJH98_17965 [Reichenbachiella sp.]|uniref:hypothetical protein n=1 Tax=Reichenbachiella sp. TaxID=2184521 RepID=UPI0032996A5A
MKTTNPSKKVWESILRKEKLPRKKKKSIQSYIRTNRIVISIDETPSIDLTELRHTVRSSGKLIKLEGNDIR